MKQLNRREKINKRKVATRTIPFQRNKQNKIDKIKKVLTDYPEGTTPKVIAFKSRINQATVRGMISKIEGIEQVAEIRGLYHLVAKGGVDPIFDYNFHNLLVYTHLPNYTKDKVLQTLSSQLTNYQFIIGKASKQATMRISTPKTNGMNYPINISSITLAFALFKELVYKHAGTNITMDDVTVNSIEFNKNYTNLKLEGVNCITLSSLIEQFKIYQKKDALRIEHKTKVPLNANELVKLLGVKLYEVKDV